ncbi:MAG: hypothetical protein DRG11_07625 [Epsilonproteobacteria bacterium]|nr:MAG: hypothetical protein DRG11_07625 [Campylobacterota bacterium]
MNKLTQEEKTIIEYIETNNPKSISNIDSEIKKYTSIAKEQIEGKKAVSIKLSKNDIYLLKQRALATGISYQNIIQSLVHQYTHNHIKVVL